ncbi:MAG: hypothetical protein M3Q49_00675 [Actinomycetota bacterium]|nr:hypothetical protein [Actinomycetota bacterium]MDP9484306.1 hypothetical protein [Actinomycetota bacterium]PLS83285.1 MAG: hypothetical protein CYG60_22225 [Actinomycetota bacterium]
MFVASEPHSYREVMAVAVQELRPEIEVWIGEPADLEREIPRLEPDLVVCNRPPTATHSGLLTVS